MQNVGPYSWSTSGRVWLSVTMTKCMLVSGEWYSSDRTSLATSSLRSGQELGLMLMRVRPRVTKVSLLTTCSRGVNTAPWAGSTAASSSRRHHNISTHQVPQYCLNVQSDQDFEASDTNHVQVVEQKCTIINNIRTRGGTVCSS